MWELLTPYPDGAVLAPRQDLALPLPHRHTVHVVRVALEGGLQGAIQNLNRDQASTIKENSQIAVFFFFFIFSFQFNLAICFSFSHLFCH